MSTEQQQQQQQADSGIGHSLDQLMSTGGDPQLEQIVNDVISTLPNLEHGAESVLTAGGEKIYSQLQGILANTDGAKLISSPLVKDCAQLISYLHTLLKGGQAHGAATILEAGKRAADVLAARHAVSIPLGHKEHFLQKVILAPIHAIRKRKTPKTATTSTSDTEEKAKKKKAVKAEVSKSEEIKQE